MTPPETVLRRQRGFSLVELMVALALGLLLTIAMTTVYITSKSSFTRQQQLSTIQQNVRIAFEYLSSDARMVGHLGCFTGKATLPAGDFNSSLAANSIATNYALGVEGYEYKNATANALTLGSSAPANTTTATEWETNNGGAAAINTIPVTTVASGGLTPGSDVLVIRTVAGRPVRLAADTPISSATSLSVENLAGGTCSTGTAKASGFCANSHGLIASCTRARVFQVQSITAQTLNLTAASQLGINEQFTAGTAEVFPMQTLVYYVAASSSGTGTSLYRRTFDGDNATGLEQELIDGVENMQVRYGVDTDADGIINAPYVNANAVTDWNTVVAVRMSLLMRSATPLESDTTVATTGLVNGVTVTYPTTGRKYDRRVFTTTVAVRNKISYF